jgi:ankyrin repeat protein
VSTPDLQLIQYLLEHGASATRPLTNGFTPLIYLARGDKGEHPEKMRLLLERGAPVNARGPKGRTAMHYAASAGFLNVIVLLLDHGADVTLVDDAGETALNVAQRTGKIAAASLLLRVSSPSL